MPVLGTLLVNAFAGLVAWLTTYVTRKVAFGLAAVAGMTALTVALYVAFRAALSVLVGVTTGVSSIFVDALQMAVPPVASVCLSTYMTMWAACSVYVWQRDLLHLYVKV